MFQLTLQTQTQYTVKHRIIIILQNNLETVSAYLKVKACKPGG